MIVRNAPRFADVLFAMRGSILPRIAGRLAFIAALSIGAVLLVGARPAMVGHLSAMPFTLLGLSLSIFMSFRNTACYDRWWEGRRLWGQLVIAARSFARQTATLPIEERAPMLEMLCAFAGGLGARLRDRDEAAAIRPWWPGLPGGLPNPTDAVLREVGRRCLTLVESGTIDPIRHSVLEGTLTELAHVQGGCERITTTPLPFSYSLLLHRIVYLFCCLLPFALAPELGWWVPLPTLVIAYAFFGLDALGDELSDPFGDDDNDLPLDALVRTVERDLLSAAGRHDLPPAIEPVGFVLR